jgi:hypothetical protein
VDGTNIASRNTKKHVFSSDDSLHMFKLGQQLKVPWKVFILSTDGDCLVECHKLACHSRWHRGLHSVEKCKD